MDLPELNYVKIMLALLTTCFSIASLLMYLFGVKTSATLTRLVRFGKAVENEKMTLLSAGIPKTSFKHFYRVAIVVHSISLYLFVSAYVFKREVPQSATSFLDAVCGHRRVPTVSRLEAFVSVALLTFQVCRRFYESNFVSVFSKNATLNWNHYIAGILFYMLNGVAIPCEAPEFDSFSTLDSRNQEGINWGDITGLQVAGIGLFFWGWYHQFVTTAILADLRKDKKGGVVSDKYKIPEGDWFEYLSSPHLTAEIIMYTALTLILWNHTVWWYVFVMVLLNQIESIYASHKWYKETFKNFPADRKAFIPFVI